MMKYMLTTKECFFNNAGTFYCNTRAEAIKKATDLHNIFGLAPEAVYKYNPKTDRYDIYVCRFTIKAKEA